MILKSKALSARNGTLAPPTNVVLVSVRLDDLFHLQVVVSSIKADVLTDPSGRAEGSRIERPLDQLAVIAIRGCGHNPKRNPPSIGQQTSLHPGLPTVGRIRAGPIATERRFGHRAIHRLPRPTDPGLLVVGEESLRPQSLEQARGAPLLESIVDGALGSETPREGSPLDAGTEQVDDAREAPPVVGPRTTPSRRRSAYREEGRDSKPEILGKIELRRNRLTDEHSGDSAHQRVKPGFDSKGGFRIRSKSGGSEAAPRSVPTGAEPPIVSASRSAGPGRVERSNELRPSALPGVKFMAPGPVEESMAKTAVVSSKGQITLPKELRERHHLQEGATVLVLETKEGVLIRSGRRTLRGLLKGRIDPDKAEKAVRSLREEWRV